MEGFGFDFGAEVVVNIFLWFSITILKVVFNGNLTEVGTVLNAFVSFEFQGMVWLNGLGFEFFRMVHGDFIGNKRGLILGQLLGIKGMMHKG